jgi:hypothetical protein
MTPDEHAREAETLASRAGVIHHELEHGRGYDGDFAKMQAIASLAQVHATLSLRQSAPEGTPGPRK